MKLKDIYNKSIFYFKRGYAGYIALVAGIIQFIIVFYELYFASTSWVRYFPNIYIFSLVSLPGLCLASIIIGLLDRRYKTLETE
jgi:hypothetical protein